MLPARVKAKELANQRFRESDEQVGAGAPSYPKTAQDHFRRVYYEANDLIVSAIDQRFNQESFSSYAQMETLCLGKAANGDDYEAAKMLILGRCLGN